MPRTSRDPEFSEFVRVHRTDLLRSAALLTAGDAHRAEDLVQTALAKLYVAWPRVRGQDALSYTRRIVVNAHIDETRRSWWRRERSVSEPPERPDLAAAGRPAAGGGSDGDAVRAALAALPPRMRACIVLRHWLDLSVDESADLLGCTPGTVTTR